MVQVPEIRQGEPAPDAPSSDLRILIRETPDGLGIYNPSRRNMPLILFLLLWLGGWAVGEYFAVGEILRSGDVTAETFLLLWVTFWTLGGLFCWWMVLWALFGSERLFITSGALVHSVGILFLRRKRVFPLHEIGGFALADAGNPRHNSETGGAVVFDVRGKTYRFGLGLSRSEADASLAAIRRTFAAAGAPYTES